MLLNTFWAVLPLAYMKLRLLSYFVKNWAGGAGVRGSWKMTTELNQVALSGLEHWESEFFTMHFKVTSPRHLKSFMSISSTWTVQAEARWLILGCHVARSGTWAHHSGVLWCITVFAIVIFKLGQVPDVYAVQPCHKRVNSNALARDTSETTEASHFIYRQESLFTWACWELPIKKPSVAYVSNTAFFMANQDIQLTRTYS